MASTSDNPGQTASAVDDSSWDKTERKFSRYVYRRLLSPGDFLTLSIPFRLLVTNRLYYFWQSGGRGCCHFRLLRVDQLLPYNHKAYYEHTTDTNNGFIGTVKVPASIMILVRNLQTGVSNV